MFRHLCVLGQQWDGQQPTGLGRVIMSADTGSHTQKPLITVGDVTIIEHFVK